MAKKTTKKKAEELTPEQAQNELAKLMNSMVTLCAVDIMRHSMEHFMNAPITKEQKYRLAIKIAEAGYKKAIDEMDAFFLNNPEEPKN